MVRSLWKPSYIEYNLLEDIIKNKTRSVIKTKARSSIILSSFVGLIFEVYTGKVYTKLHIKEKMVGHKLGEFVFTRKIGKIHEKKTNKKVKK